jgi:hypothetical protein
MLDRKQQLNGFVKMFTALDTAADRLGVQSVSGSRGHTSQTKVRRLESSQQSQIPKSHAESSKAAPSKPPSKADESHDRHIRTPNE